jgi:transposase-like protein
MPWKETTTMEQKVEFICEWLSEKYSISELCRAFEISRPTAYRMIQRYEDYGIKGLKEQSRAPINHPNRTSTAVEDRILKLKDIHKRWGAKKLHKLLFNDFAEMEIPSIITVHNILLRNGLVCPQRRLRRVKPIAVKLKGCRQELKGFSGKYVRGISN